jgi:hypothetical protein
MARGRRDKDIPPLIGGRLLDFAGHIQCATIFLLHRNLESGDFDCIIVRNLIYPCVKRSAISASFHEPCLRFLLQGGAWVSQLLQSQVICDGLCQVYGEGCDRILPDSEGLTNIVSPSESLGRAWSEHESFCDE